MVQLKNHQTYYNKTITLLIIAVEKGEDINWARVFFQGLKAQREKWLLGGTKPLVMYVAHVEDMLLQKWFPLEGHQIIGWFVKTRYEEDEESTIQPIVGNPTPITFQAIEETMVFINEDLRSLHVPLSKTKIGYRTTVSPTGKRLATKGEVIKKAKMDQETVRQLLSLCFRFYKVIMLEAQMLLVKGRIQV